MAVVVVISYVYVFPDAAAAASSTATLPAGLSMQPQPDSDPVQSSGYLAVFKNLEASQQNNKACPHHHSCGAPDVLLLLIIILLLLLLQHLCVPPPVCLLAQVRTLLLDDILANPDGPDKENATLDFETKALKDLREVITHKGLDVRRTTTIALRSATGPPCPWQGC